MQVERKLIPRETGQVTMPHTFYNERARRYETLRMDATALGVIGTPIILYGRYDPDQGWLPIMDGAILACAPPDGREWRSEREAWYYEYNMRRTWREQLEKKLHQPLYAYGDDAKPYLWQEDWHDVQCVLPFREFLEITERFEFHSNKSSWEPERPIELIEEETEDEYGKPCTILVEADWEPCSLSVERFPIKIARVWLRENCARRFYIMEQDKRVFFETFHDWFHARLYFSGDGGDE